MLPFVGLWKGATSLETAVLVHLGLEPTVPFTKYWPDSPFKAIGILVPAKHRGTFLTVRVPFGQNED